MKNENQQAPSEKMVVYESLRAVPENAQKPFTGKSGFKGTDINPMWRIKRMTEVFGPIGIGWYYDVVDRHIEKSTDNETLCTFVSIKLYIKQDGEWSKPIYGEGGNTFCERVFSKRLNKEVMTTSDEAYKMALTDAFSNATKQLGLGADIWFENDKKHSTKYDVQQEKNANEAPAAPAQVNSELDKEIAAMKATKSMEEAQQLWNANKHLQKEPKYLAATNEMVAKFNAKKAAQQQNQQQQ